ncbi:MAG: antitoxin Xre/MbcA/ParS toxin-binding domain-containing protein [Pseudomonadota bacterium]
MKKIHQTSNTDPGFVLAKAAVRSSQLLGLTHVGFARIIGISETSMYRINNGERPIDPTTKEGELAALLVRLYRSLDALVGNDTDKRHAWLTSYNSALNGIPKELILKPDGLVFTLSYLDAMRAPI